MVTLIEFSHPTIAFASLKGNKSEVSVVSLSNEDPSSHDGMIRIMEKLIPLFRGIYTDKKAETLPAPNFEWYKTLPTILNPFF